MILLINPPPPKGFVSNKDTMGGLGQLYPYGVKVKMPPIDLFYTAGCLLKSRCDVKVIDSLVNGLKEIDIIEAVKKYRPEIVGIRTSLPTYKHDIEFASSIKCNIKAKVGMFGSVVKFCADELINCKSLDFLVIDEPEVVFGNIVKNGLAKANGVWYKENNKVIKNPPQDFLTDLDSLPFPAWELVNYRQYKIHAFFGDENFLPMLTSRGCPFSCMYCPYTVLQGKVWRSRSVTNVVEEVKHIYFNLNVKNILFRDPEFTINEKRTMEICEQIIKNNIKIRWICETRPDTLSEKLLKKMAEAGCIQINIGIESLSDHVLENIGRGKTSISHIKTVFNWAARYNIRLFNFFIIGLPSETKRDILKTIDFAYKNTNVNDLVQFCCATPYPGTKLMSWAQINNFIVDKDYTNYTGYSPIMRNENLTIRQLKMLHNYACHKFMLKKESLRKMLAEKKIITFCKGIIKRIIYSIEEIYVKFFL